MATNNIPSWEEWDTQLNPEQRAYSLYKILASLDGRLTRLEHQKFKHLASSFLGGFASVGSIMLAKVVFWK